MIRAMIFDPDGTLVQTEKLKAISNAWAAVALRPELNEEDSTAGVKAPLHRRIQFSGNPYF